MVSVSDVSTDATARHFKIVSAAPTAVQYGIATAPLSRRGRGGVVLRQGGKPNITSEYEPVTKTLPAGRPLGISYMETRMKVRQRNKLPKPIQCAPSDKLICKVYDTKAQKWYEFTEKIGRLIVIDTIVTFDLDEPTLGLSDGIGAIFGKAVPDV